MQNTRKEYSGRRAVFPRAEKVLHEQFQMRRSEGRQIKRWWFTAKMKELVQELYADDEKAEHFKFSSRWLIGFCKHAAQKSLDEVKEIMSSFHKHLIRIRKRGTYQLKDISNIDKIIDSARHNSLFLRMEKKRIKPLIIFCGKGSRIKMSEKEKWDKRVRVAFQSNAWCDERIMKKYIQTDWGNVFSNPSTLDEVAKY